MNKDYCFCGLAIGRRYRDYAIDLAGDFSRFHPGTAYLLITDRPEDFKTLGNVIAVSHKRTGVMFPFHDRRFAIKEALKLYRTTIQIDTDIRLLKPLPLPGNIRSHTGMTCRYENILTALGKWMPNDIKYFRAIADKLNIFFKTSFFVCELIFVISRDNGKEDKFIDYWAKIANYLEIHRVCRADGPTIGLSLSGAGYEVRAAKWIDEIVEGGAVKHFQATRFKKSYLENLRFRIEFHRRLNLARIRALKNYRFYYT